MPGRNFFKLRILSIFFVLLMAILGMLLATSISIIGYTYKETSKAFLSNADQQIYSISREAMNSTIDRLNDTKQLAQSMAFLVNFSNAPIISNKELVLALLGTLSYEENVEAFFVGDESGDVLVVGRILPNQKYVTESMVVPIDSKFMVRVIDRDKETAKETREYLDRNGKVLGSEEIPMSLIRYDARVRPWYSLTKEAKETQWTDIYTFENGQIGITAGAPIMNDKKVIRGVVGVDMGMNQVSSMLSKVHVGKTGIPFLTNSRGELIGHPDATKTSKKEGSNFTISTLDDLEDRMLSHAFSDFKKTGSVNSVMEFNNKKYISNFSKFPKGYGSGWIMGVVVPLDDFVGPLKSATRATILMAFGIVLLAVVALVLFSRKLSLPISQLAEELKKIQNFEIDDKNVVTSNLYEVALISEGIQAMKKNLRSFARYVPKDLVRHLVSSGHNAELGGEKKRLAIMFSDIEGFTSVSEKMSSEDLMLHLSNYLDSLSQVIIKEGGTIDKYIGDAIMAFWGAPKEDPRQAFNACHSVLKCLREVSEFNYLSLKESKPILPTRFGLNLADVVVGNMGSSERMNYTIIGDGVNLAARLEALNKEYGTYALVSESIYKEVNTEYTFRPLDVVAVKGKNQGIVIFELLGSASGEFRCDKKTLEMSEIIFEAFDLYRGQNWTKSKKLYNEVAKLWPDDKVAKMYVERCLFYHRNPPGDEWDGILRMKHK